MPSILYDLIAIAIIALTAFLGFRKGGFLALCSLIATLVAFVGALYISNVFAEPVGQLLLPFVREPIQQIVSSSLDGTGSVSEFVDLLRQNPTVGGFVDQMSFDLLENGLAPVTANIADFVAFQLARFVLFILGFFVVMAAWTVLSHALNLAFLLPVLSSANAIAGIVLGTVQGLAIVYVGAWAISFGLLSPAQMDQTILLHFFVQYSPLTLLAALSGMDNLPLNW